MEKVRINNDLLVKYTVFRDGQPESFVGATDITVTVTNEAYKKAIPNTFDIVGNVVNINIDAADFSMCGKYRVTLKYVRGNDIEIDALAFEGVPYTSLTGGTEIVGVEVVTVNISGDIGIAIPDNNKIDLNGLNSDIQRLQFDTVNPVAGAQAGQVYWSDEGKTLVLNDGYHTHPIGKELGPLVKNNSGQTILNGQACYVIGSTGDNPTIGLASTENGDVAQKTIGVATMDIANNAFGIVTTFGEVNDIDTSALTLGAIVYLGANGLLTTTEPVAPTPKIVIGLCVRQHAQVGKLFVSTRPIARLSKLSEVHAPVLTDNDVLRYNGTTLRWEVYSLANKADLVGGKIPTSQLPSYVDDVLEYANLAAFPATGETGKIYVALNTNLTYRWGGTAYVEISKSLALGETADTAYRGDRGKTAYDHSQATGNPHSTTAAQIPNAPAGTIAATTVQGAINELAGDIAQVETNLNANIDQVRADMNKTALKSFNFIEKISDNFTTGYYIDKYGIPILFSSNLFYTQLIDVLEGDVFFLKYRAGGLVSVISQFDLTNTFSEWSSGIVKNDSWQEYMYIVPSGVKKVRFCSYDSQTSIISKCFNVKDNLLFFSNLIKDVDKLKYDTEKFSKVDATDIRILNETDFGNLQNPGYSKGVVDTNRAKFNFETLKWEKTGIANVTTTGLALFPYYFKSITFKKLRTIFSQGRYDANIYTNNMLVYSFINPNQSSFNFQYLNETTWDRSTAIPNGSQTSLLNAKYLRYEKDDIDNKKISIYVEYVDGTEALYKVLVFPQEAFLIIGEFDFTTTNTIGNGVLCKDIYDFVLESNNFDVLSNDLQSSGSLQYVLIPGGIGGLMKFNLLEYLTSSQFTGRKIKMDWYACGDSITTGAGSTGNNNSYVPRLAQLVPFNSVTNRGISGSSIRAHFDSNGVVDRGRLITQINGIPQNTTGFITIAMGVNDAGWGFAIGDVDTTLARTVSALNDGVSLVDGTETTATFCDALRYNIETLRGRAPEAIIVFILPIYRAGTDHVVENYRTAMRKILNAYGIPYLDANLALGFNRYNFTTGGVYTADGLHPNDLGYNKYARYLLYEFSKYAI